MKSQRLLLPILFIALGALGLVHYRELPIVRNSLLYAQIHQALAASDSVFSVQEQAFNKALGFSILAYPLAAAFGAATGLKLASFIFTALWILSCPVLFRRLDEAAARQRSRTVLPSGYSARCHVPAAHHLWLAPVHPCARERRTSDADSPMTPRLLACCALVVAACTTGPAGHAAPEPPSTARSPLPHCRTVAGPILSRLSLDGGAVCTLSPGPFAVVLFDDGPFGLQVAVAHLEPMDNPIVGAWALTDRYWSGDEWGRDVTSVGWTSDGLTLFVATSGAYGSDALFALELLTRNARRLFPTADLGAELLEVHSYLGLEIVEVSETRRIVHVTTRSAGAETPTTWDIPW